jgi:hypothetical protein
MNLVLNPFLAFWNWRRKKIMAKRNEPVSFGYTGTDKPVRLSREEFFENETKNENVDLMSRKVDFLRTSWIKDEALGIYHFADDNRIRYVHISPVTLKQNREYGQNLPAIVLYDDGGREIGYFHSVIFDGEAAIRVVHDDAPRPQGVEGIAYVAVTGKLFGVLWEKQAFRVIGTEKVTSHGCGGDYTHEELVKQRFSIDVAEPVAAGV